MTWVTRVYLTIKYFKCKWFTKLTEWLMVNVIMPVLYKMGEDALNLLRGLILQASKKDWSGEKKAKWVFDEFKARWGGQEIEDRFINLAIELLYAELLERTIIPS